VEEIHTLKKRCREFERGWKSAKLQTENLKKEKELT